MKNLVWFQNIYVFYQLHYDCRYNDRSIECGWGHHFCFDRCLAYKCQKTTINVRFRKYQWQGFRAFRCIRYRSCKYILASIRRTGMGLWSDEALPLQWECHWERLERTPWLSHLKTKKVYKKTVLIRLTQALAKSKTKSYIKSS